MLQKIHKNNSTTDTGGGGGCLISNRTDRCQPNYKFHKVLNNYMASAGQYLPIQLL